MSKEGITVGPSDRREDGLIQEFDWIDVGTTHSNGRRFNNFGRVASVGAIVLIASVLVTSVFLTGGVTAATSFTAEDVGPIETQNGLVDSLTVEPEGEVWYEGLEEEPDHIHLAVQVRSDDTDGWETVGEQTVGETEELGHEGEVTFSFETLELFDESSLTPQDFRAGPGQEETTGVEVQLVATFPDADADGDDLVVTEQDEYAVTVVNVAAGGGIGGDANTGGS